MIRYTDSGSAHYRFSAFSKKTEKGGGASKRLLPGDTMYTQIVRFVFIKLILFSFASDGN